MANLKRKPGRSVERRSKRDACFDWVWPMMRKLSNEFSHDCSRAIQKRSELPSRLSCRSPLFQHRRQQPSRKILSAVDHRSPFDVHSENLVSESNCASDPIRLPPRTRQASIPIEASIALGAPFNRAPRLPLQIGHVISRAATLLMDLFRLQQTGIQQKG